MLENKFRQFEIYGFQKEVEYGHDEWNQSGRRFNKMGGRNQVLWKKKWLAIQVRLWCWQMLWLLLAPIYWNVTQIQVFRLEYGTIFTCSIFYFALWKRNVYDELENDKHYKILSVTYYKTLKQVYCLKMWDINHLTY